MSVYIRNRLAQPLELHLDSGTVIIGPYAEVAVQESAAASPQVVALEKRGQLWVRAEKAPPATSVASETTDSATSQDSTKETSKRGAAAPKVKARKSN